MRDALQTLGIRAAVPREERAIRSGGGWTTKVYTLLPGYVFLALEYSAENYYRVKAIPHVLRFLGSNGLSPSYLPHLEVEWLRLLDHGGAPLKPSRVEELPEDGIRIVEGVLRHFPVRRIDFDKRARRAKVEISLCGESKTITLSTDGGEDESSYTAFTRSRTKQAVDSSRLGRLVEISGKRTGLNNRLGGEAHPSAPCFSPPVLSVARNTV